MESRDFTLRVGFLSDTGRERERNEDALALYLPYGGEASVAAFDAILVVADGMGGHEAGDVASRFVADALIGALTSDPARPDDRERTGQYMRALLRRVDRQLRAHMMALGVGTAGSTATVAALHGETLHIAHVGDSRLYRLRDGTLEQLTADHSWVAEQVRLGLMTHDEAISHPRRNLLIECLGIGRSPRVSVRREAVLPGDRYMLCSDGLHAEVNEAMIAHVLREEAAPQDAAARLVAVANQAGGTDNITVIVCDAQPVSTHVTQPQLHALPRTGNGSSHGVSTLPGAPAAGADADDNADSHARTAAINAAPAVRGVRRFVGSAIALTGVVILLGGAVAAWRYLDPPADAEAGVPGQLEPLLLPEPPLPGAPGATGATGATTPPTPAAAPARRDSAQATEPRRDDAAGETNPPSPERGDPR